MKRSDFLRKLGIGIGVAVVAPSVIANNATTENNAEWNVEQLTAKDVYKHRVWSKGSVVSLKNGYLYVITKVTHTRRNVYYDIHPLSANAPYIEIVNLHYLNEYGALTSLFAYRR